MHDSLGSVSHSIVILCGALGRNIGEAHRLIQILRASRLAQQFIDGMSRSQEF